MADTICFLGQHVEVEGGDVKWMPCGKFRIFIPELFTRLQLTSDFSCSAVQSLSRITVSLYANMTTRNDIPIGRHEILCEPHHGSSC